MRRTALLGATVSAAIGLAAALIPFAGIAAAARPSPGPAAVAFSPVNLRTSYMRFLGKEKTEPRGIAYARGRHGTAAGAPVAAACSEPHCPLTYHGGDVQHAPRVYLLLWGPKWTTTGPAAYLNDFLSGLGVQPDDTWSTTTEQYGDRTGHATFTRTVFAGVFHDTTTPPHGATQDQLAAEADAFYSNQGLSGGVDTQVVVATQTGTCPEGFYAQSGSTCNNPSGAYCAWHSVSSVRSVPYTNLPYLLDSGNPGCGEDAINNVDDGFSIVEGHEYAESVTDPIPDSGWIDLNDASGGEIGDKCAWTGLADVTLSTGSFAMQPLWSNSAHKCVQSTVLKPLAVTTTALHTGAVGAPYGATLTASGGFTPYAWSRISGTKPPGTSFSTGGVWSGTPTTAGTYAFSVQVTDNYGATATKALSITITRVSITTTSLPSGTVGTSYNASVTAAGGTAPYTWSRISGTKPPGTSFSTGGVWSGTPTTAGTYAFSVQVTDHYGATATTSLSITITRLSITTTSLPSGTVGTPYNASVTATGGTAPYTWSRISGTKPPGTSFSTAGVWSGTPTTAGTYSFSVQVTDHAGATAAKALEIVIAG